MNLRSFVVKSPTATGLTRFVNLSVCSFEAMSLNLQSMGPEMQPGNRREQWYALQLRTRFEKVVASHLRGKGYEEYLPTYRSRRHWSDRIKEIEVPLFA